MSHCCGAPAHASFALDIPVLLPLCGYLAARLSARLGVKPWVPLGLAIAGFWGVAGALYLDLLDFPGLGAAGRGNHFMWNSGAELLGLPPPFAFPQPTYEEWTSLPNLAAMLLFFVAYPLALYAGYLLGRKRF